MIKIFQPVFIFAITWLIVIVLYSLRLSNVLDQNINDAYIFLLIAIPFFTLGYLLPFIFRKSFNTSVKIMETSDSNFESKVFNFFYFWAIISAIEIIYSKGIPILWLITGSPKTYMDFGIPSIHGFMNALQLVLSLISFYYYRITKKRKFILLTIFFIVWNLCLITRQVLIVLLIEIFVMQLLMSKNKLNILKKLIIFAFLGIIGFGILGDFRTGGEAFLQIASPTDKWPQWLPSGFLWVYIYITTPLNNLLFNFTFPVTHLNFGFSNTLSILFPSVIRNIIFDSSTDAFSGNLVTQALNVSTAFTPPYIDMGFYGIGIFSFFIGSFSNLVWWVSGIKKIFFHAIIIQIIILSIFLNMFMYLPVVFQFVWVFYFFRKGNKVEKV
ncbi:MAG TPA: O-antigen polymerase [Mucilaginibacter sp.]|jgi:oligosaccharide repeat unit polymerase